MDLINKFIKCLDEAIDTLKFEISMYRKSSEYNDQIIIKNNHIEIIKFLKKFLKEDNDKEFFLGFKELSELVSRFNFTNKEKRDIILYVIKKNINHGIINADNKDIIKSLMNIVSSDYNFLKTRIDNIFNNQEVSDELTLELKSLLNNVNDVLTDESKKLIDNVKERHNLINNSFDIETILTSLRELNVIDALCTEFTGVYNNYKYECLSGLESKYINDLSNYAKGLLNKAADKYKGKNAIDINYNILANDKKDIFFIDDIISIITWFVYPYSVKNNKCIFDRFSLLVDTFNKCTLTKAEQLELIFDIVNRNIDLGILNTELNNDDNKYIIDDNLTFANSTFGSFGLTNALDYRNIHINNYSLLLNTLSSNNDNFNNLKEAHILINKSYLTKKDNYMEEDIINIKEALKLLGFNEIEINEYEKILSKNLRIKNKVPTIKEEIIPKKHLFELKPLLSKKEYKELYDSIYNEILIYFDLNTESAFRYLTNDEITILYNLLKELEIPKNKIEEYIWKVNRFNSLASPIIKYNALKEKIQKHLDNEEILSLVDEMEAAIMLILETEKDSTDYFELEQSVQNNLSKVLEIISI